MSNKNNNPYNTEDFVHPYRSTIVDDRLGVNMDNARLISLLPNRDKTQPSEIKDITESYENMIDHYDVLSSYIGIHLAYLNNIKKCIDSIGIVYKGIVMDDTKKILINRNDYYLGSTVRAIDRNILRFGTIHAHQVKSTNSVQLHIMLFKLKDSLLEQFDYPSSSGATGDDIANCHEFKEIINAPSNTSGDIGNHFLNQIFPKETKRSIKVIHEFIVNGKMPTKYKPVKKINKRDFYAYF